MNDDRDAKILAYVAERKLSYDVIAQMFTPPLTRGIVAGVVFRDRHPKVTRVKSLGARGRNMTGKGWQRPTYRPEKTAQSPG